MWVPFKGTIGLHRQVFLGYGLVFRRGPGWPSWPYLNAYTRVDIDYWRIVLELGAIFATKALLGAGYWTFSPLRSLLVRRLPARNAQDEHRYAAGK